MPAFFIIVSSSVIGLLLLRWLFDLRFHFFDIKEEVWDLWIPLIYPWIPILIWLRPKLRILNYKDSDKGRFGLQMLTWGTMMATMCISQSYLTTASGKLANLSSIDQIAKLEKTRYYKINNFSMAPYFGGVYTEFSTSGKYNNEFNFNVFFVTPIVGDTNKRWSTYPKVWYCVKFHERVSNRLSNEEKQQKYEVFYSECLDKMNHYQFHNLDHFEKIPVSDDLENFSKAVENRIKEKPANEIVLLKPIMESYESRNKNKLPWIFGAFAIGSIVIMICLLFGTIDYAEIRHQQEGIKPKQDDLVDMLRFLIPKDDHFATSILLDINILVFVIMFFSGVNIISPRTMELLHWGGNRRAEILGGEWWRLATSMFLHGSIMHILGNVYGLVIAALFVEPLLGRKNYFILYFIAGICGSLASIWWHANTISVGASGAIFGLYGAVLGLLFTDAFPKEGKKGMLTFIGVYVLINLLMGLLGGVDNAAHIGGLLSGAVLGVMLYKLSPKSKDTQELRQF